MPRCIFGCVWPHIVPTYKMVATQNSALLYDFYHDCYLGKHKQYYYTLSNIYSTKGTYILELEYCQNTYKHEKENKHYISCRILLPRGQTTHLFWIGLPVFAITLRLSTINNVHYQNRITYGHTSQLFTVNPIWLPQYSLY